MCLQRIWHFTEVNLSKSESRKQIGEYACRNVSLSFPVHIKRRKTIPLQVTCLITPYEQLGSETVAKLSSYKA